MIDHTNRPWEYYVATMGGDEIAVIHPQSEPDDYRICTVFDEAGGGTSPEANARHIVHCVNNHERLVEALRDVLDLAEYISNYEGYSGKPLEYVDARALLASLEAEKWGEL